MHEETQQFKEVSSSILDSLQREHREFTRYLKIALWVVSVMFVLAIVSITRSFYISQAVSTLDSQTEELIVETDAAKDAAVEARDSLNAALERSASSASNSEAIEAALLSITRIENELCGGPCDQP